MTRTANPAARQLMLRDMSNTGLSDAQIRAFAPSVFQEQPRKGMSNRYTFVNTGELVAEMRKQDFVPTEVQVYDRRRPERRPYAMHMLRFSQKGAKGALREVGDTVPQVVLRNSHDGSSRFELYDGMFRLVCLNGLVVSDSSLVEPIRVKHSINPVLEALCHVEQIVEQQKLVFEHIGAMRGTKLSEPQQLAFARQALTLQSGAGVIEPAALLHSRRTEDNGADVWRVFNRVQENLLRGGIEGRTADNRRTVTRGTSTMYRQLGVNAALWTLAMQAIGQAAATSKTAVDAISKAKADAVDVEFEVLS